MKAAQVPINRQVDKKVVVYLYKVKYYSAIKRMKSYNFDNMD